MSNRAARAMLYSHTVIRACAKRFEFYLDGERFEVAYGEGRGELPVRERGGRIAFYRWGALGREYVADDNTPGWGAKFPEPGWAPLEEVRANGWYKVEPRSVKILASRFMIVDRWQIERWFELRPGEFIQGLLATLGPTKRVYVVTVPVPKPYTEEGTKLTVWPRVVAAPAGRKTDTPP
jgi:hypothetical protein